VAGGVGNIGTPEKKGMAEIRWGAGPKIVLRVVKKQPVMTGGVGGAGKGREKAKMPV